MERALTKWKLPAADTYFAPLLTEQGFEIEKLEVAFSHCRRFRTAVDGGAHIGTWSARMAQSFRRVLAVEPAADAIDCLVENTGLLLNVTPIRAALGASRIFASLRDDPARPGNTGARFIGDGNDFEVIRLDDLGIPDLDFVKLDVEGYEYFALLGAERTVRAQRPVVMLEDKDFGARYGLPQGAARDLLASWGMVEVEHMKNDYVYLFRNG